MVYVSETVEDPHVQALDAATGTKLWTSTVTGSALRLAGGVLYVTGKDKESLHALDTATGAGT
ncbi:PQQ-binding-like beta-propeller repeat protein [Streptomyces sp. NPDC046876]|uniref:outer membrane protein assembly factor BamB family protein n=1 Tax=Streptomyces sp. NPDC046876 TaxID=3155616 RepID=UPI0033F65FCD